MSGQAAAVLVDPATDPNERRKGIGGSDVAAILGLSEYKTPLQLYLEKTGLVAPDRSESEAAEWGNIMEPVIAREYVRRTGTVMVRREGHSIVELHPHPITKGGGVTVIRDALPKDDPLVSRLGTLTHPKYPFARGHVDGYGLDENGIAERVWEGKTASEYLKGRWGAPDTDEVPESYLVQTMWYLWLADLPVTDLCVVIGGNKFRRYIIRRDEALIRMMIAAASEFWQRVEERDPPAPTDTEEDGKALAQLFGQADKGKVLPATRIQLELCRDLHRVKAELEAAEAKKRQIENELKLFMADAYKLDLGVKGAGITWSTVSGRASFNGEAALAELCEMLAFTPEEVEALKQRHTSVGASYRSFTARGLDKLAELEEEELEAVAPNKEEYPF